MLAGSSQALHKKIQLGDLLLALDERGEINLYLNQTSN